MFLSKPKGSAFIQHELPCQDQKGEIKNSLDRITVKPVPSINLRTVALKVIISGYS